MATAYKVLGQVAPNANSDTDLYTVTAPAISAISSSLVICNRGATTTVRVAVRPAGAAIADKHYLVYEQPIDQYDTFILTIGITLAVTDVITVRTAAATCSFSLFGMENS